MGRPVDVSSGVIGSVAAEAELVPTAVVTVVQVSHIEQTLARAQAFGAPVSEIETDVTPEGVPFIEDDQQPGRARDSRLSSW